MEADRRTDGERSARNSTESERKREREREGEQASFIQLFFAFHSSVKTVITEEQPTEKTAHLHSLSVSKWVNWVGVVDGSQNE